MYYFTSEYLDFFKELAANNHREWFHANKKRYEAHVKKPFHHFISDLIAEVQKDDASVDMEAKDAIFRINRDVRFAKDKSPYKLHMSAVISPGGRKDKSIPGLYIECSPEKLGIYGGAWGPDKTQLTAIRHAIAHHPDIFSKVKGNKDFVKHFGEIQGEKNVRLPKEFQEASQSEELISNKQFYFFTHLPADTILKESLMETVLEYYQASKPVNTFLREAIG